MYQYTGRINKIVDGDTVVVDIDLGFRIVHTVKVRLYGLNTPELHDANPEIRETALKAKALLMEYIPEGSAIYIETVKDATEKYGRYLATIWPEAGSREEKASINSLLVAQGLAVQYFGGKR